ncbi:uncharacterized protein LOC120327031 [Styela clava]
MKNFIVLTAFLLLCIAVSEIAGKCCGRGKHGFCEDCARVSLFGHRKCCGEGSGYGCNIFCCNCGSCRHGHASITYKKYGHKYGGKYTCKQEKKYYHGVKDEDGQERDTWEVFNKIDQNEDATISPDEFLDAIKDRLTDKSIATIFASHLLRSNDRGDISAFLDTIKYADDDYDDDSRDGSENAHDAIRTLAMEFKRMDADDDGFIQASEFDRDLE